MVNLYLEGLVLGCSCQGCLPVRVSALRSLSLAVSARCYSALYSYTEQSLKTSQNLKYCITYYVHLFKMVSSKSQTPHYLWS